MSESPTRHFDKLLSDGAQIIMDFGAKIAGVQEVGIGDDHGPALADAAVGDQPVRTDLAIAVKNTGRNGDDTLARQAEGRWTALVRGVEA